MWRLFDEGRPGLSVRRVFFFLSSEKSLFSRLPLFRFTYMYTRELTYMDIKDRRIFMSTTHRTGFFLLTSRLPVCTRVFGAPTNNHRLNVAHALYSIIGSPSDCVRRRSGFQNHRNTYTRWRVTIFQNFDTRFRNEQWVSCVIYFFGFYTVMRHDFSSTRRSVCFFHNSIFMPRQIDLSSNSTLFFANRTRHFQ